MKKWLINIIEKSKLRETPHNSGNSPITLNPDGIRKNVQHKSCRGQKDLQLCRGSTAKKWADPEKIDGTMMAAETLNGKKTEFELE